MSAGQPIYLDEESVLHYLSWDTLIPAIEGILRDVTQKDQTQSIQPPRLIMRIPHKEGALLCMPSFSGKQNILGCKVVSSFQTNVDRGLPSIYGTVLLLDPDTGKVKMIMEGGEITAWRTAAASVVATKHLHKGEKRVLAILGAGVQSRVHALAFQHYFKFSEVRVWNRTYDRAEKLCSELGEWAKPYRNNELCVRGANVVVTATYASEPIVDAAWLLPGTHINAVGFGVNHHNELSLSVYKHASVFVDNMPGAVQELAGLIHAGIKLYCELGEVISGARILPEKNLFTVFHSMGMSLEDVTTAELIYNNFLKKREQVTTTLVNQASSGI